ncbi:MAG: glycosyltransferase [bacterium]
MNKRIGVVIVNFNSGLYLKRCLDSLCHSDEALSIVIVDNNSSDHSLEPIKRVDTGDHSLKVVRNETNIGFSCGVNIGRSHLDCDYLMLLNPDCQVHPRSIKAIAEVLSEHPEAGVVGALVFNEDGTEQRGCRRNEPTIARSIVSALGLSNHFEGVELTGKELPDHPISVDAVSGSAMMLRSMFFDEVGGMDESYFLHCEDLDLCRKMREEGHTVLFEPGISVFHRQGGSGGASFQRVEKLKHQGMMKYYLKYYGDNILFGRILAPFLVWSHYAVAIFRFKLNSIFHDQDLSEAEDVFPLTFSKPAILVSGATTDVGELLLANFAETEKMAVAVAVSRSTNKRVQSENVRWLNSNYFLQAPAADYPHFDQWIHLAPIWNANLFERYFTCGAPKRIVALSSTSAEVKSASTSPKELEVVEKINEGEQWLTNYAKGIDASCTVLRPTMIYGGPQNKNINLVKKMIKLLGCFPIVGQGSGKRQPVHAQDVADACRIILGQSNVGQQYNIAGREVMSYREMVERVFASLGKSPRFIPMSRGFARVLLSIASRIPGFSMLSPEVADRMSADQNFPIDDAINDFGFDPRKFNP